MARKTLEALADTLKKYTVYEPMNGCLLWVGYRDKSGYGRTGLGPYETGYTHRVAWLVSRGPIPKGLCVAHSCDTPPCVNIDHLFLATHKENTQDMLLKGRQRKSNNAAW